MKLRQTGFGRMMRLAAHRFRDDDEGWRDYVSGLPAPVVRRLLEEWNWQAHAGQLAPDGDWTVWLMMAGRGFGKTRAGAEWVLQRARENPGARIALVGDTRIEAGKVMIEGPSGLIALARSGEPVRWWPSRGEVSFAGGARAFVYSAESAEALRGPEHHFAWVDELAKWGNGGGRAWDNLMMGLRIGLRPQVVVTTTPKPGPLLNRVMRLPRAITTGGRTVDNVHLPRPFLEWVRQTYGGTRLGAQELDGRLIEAIEGSLFPPHVLERARETPLTPILLPQEGEERWRRIVIGVDPPASAGGDACGIVVCAVDRQDSPCFHVLADCSVSGLRPEGWARAVANAAQAWRADRVIAEKNQGGEMVEAVLRGADCTLPVLLVHASRGKAARAEPVAALMEAGRVRLSGRFPELEEELGGITAGGYEGPTRSPDRADAMVWAIWALIEGARRGPPRVLAL